ncbi:dentin sialophosphoprotein isoform X1 [Anopheles coustani]|uniref:dentin sialophosphoprotein isoform X1 n=1 Tax=Anopheles coustani TaxID=139045 RepID=UPI0026589550|nr:dentin sialophosphoprotein isoform X1 [Anopheles coustani]
MTQQSLIDRALVERTLGYHGKPFQKIWETGRRENDLQRIGIGKDPDLTVYIARQKHLTLKDRAKRLKLHQFMVKKADILYSASLSVRSPEQFWKDYRQCNQFTIPSMDVFMAQDSNDKAEQLLKHVQPGDVLYGTVMPHKTAHGTMLKPLLIIGNVTYYVRNLPIKATIAPQMMAPTVKIENGAPKTSYTAETICCEVIDVAADALRLFCSTWRSMKARVPESIAYGVVKEDDVPLPYKITLTKKNEVYEDFLEQSPSFRDPSFTERLYKEVGLDSSVFYTNMSSMKGRYPSQEYASELRNSQNSKWAFRSVAQGIEHFKEGRHSEAFQCLNKALSMDPRNVEGLVARGALYANSGSFKKAVDDFEAALKLNPAHANARKYMGETLVALGRSYEEENRIEEAKKAYQDCLNIIPLHEEAQTSLDFLMKTKPFGKQIVEPTELEIPTFFIPFSASALNIGKPSSSDRHKQEPDTSGVGGSGFGGGGGSSKRDTSEPSRKDRKKESKKERKKRHKKHHSSSSESSSESTDSSDSSSDSSSSSSSSTDSSTSDSSGSRNKKRKKKSEKKVKSLSPLSKRMSAAMGGRGVGGSGGPGELVGYPIGQGSVFGQGVGAAHGQTDDYEQQVRKFLEMPRDEEDYEEKVRRFVAEANKYQKERKQLEDKSKKKKKKDEKKSKKESKKKRKSDEKKKSKKKDKSGGGGGGDDDGLDKDKLREALKIFENFPVLDELGTKLSEYYAKIEKQQSSSGSVAEALSAILGSGSGSGGAGSSRAKPSELPNLERGIGPGGAADDNTKDGKWRMMFNKDKRPTAAAKEPIATGAPAAAASSSSTSTAAMGSKQHAFSNESDDESPGGGPSSYGAPKIQPYVDVRSNRFGFSSGRYDEHRGGRGGSVEKMKPSAANLVKSGPVVLDKFGNFRLATAETPGGSGGGAGGGSKPPEPSVAPPGSRRSRSKSRHRTYGSSRSRSRSRSERRRSRSGSFRRRFSRSRSRSFSRSRSGSYSRSRSRSRSFERRRFDRRIYRGGRGGGGGGYGGGGDRMGSFGGNRFNNPRGHYRRGGFRDFRDNRFMGNRGGGGGGGGGGRDRPPFRPRYRGRFQRSYSRSTSKSPDRRPLSPGDDRLSRRDYGRRGDSRDRSVMGQGRGGGADSRERSPARRGSSRADSRDNQRADSRNRRSEDRDSSPRRRSKDDSVGGSAGNSKHAGDNDAANDSSPAGSPRDKTVGAKSKRDRRRSSSVASHNSSGGGSARIPPDVEGRWADDPREEGAGPSRRRDNGAAGDHAAALEAGEGGSHSSAAAIAAVADDATLEELEKMLTKARKERKDDMLERNKDLLKKGSSGGSGSGGY